MSYKHILAFYCTLLSAISCEMLAMKRAVGQEESEVKDEKGEKKPRQTLFAQISNAIQRNNYEDLKKLLPECNVDRVDQFSKTCLVCVAVHHGDLETFTMVYQMSKKKQIRERAFVLACALGKKDIVECLLKKDKKLIEVSVSWAIIKEHVPSSLSVSICTVTGFEAAIIYGREVIIDMLRPRGASLFTAQVQNPLMLAIHANNKGILTKILSMYHYNPRDEMPLQWALSTDGEILSDQAIT